MPRPQGNAAFQDVPGALFFPSPALSSFAFATRNGYVAPTTVETPNLYEIGEESSAEPLWLSRPTISKFVPENPSFEPPAPAGPPSDAGQIYFTYHGSLLPEDEPRQKLSEETESAGPHAWGFYESSHGALAEAGRLPSGSIDPHGAVPAATTEAGRSDNPDFYAHQVSADGSRAFFVSPDPESLHPVSDPVELYLRDHGTTVLVSKNELAGGTPSPAYEEEGTATGITPVAQPGRCTGGCGLKDYVYATPDGGEAFFMSKTKLALGPRGEMPAGTGPWTFRRDTRTGSLTYVPAVSGPILASSDDGSRLLYLEYAGGLTRANAAKLYLFANGASTQIAELPEPREVAEEFRELDVAPALSTHDGKVFAFMTNAPVPGAKSADGSASANDATGYDQIYRYDSGTSEVRCVSCPPGGAAAVGPAHMSNNEQEESNEHTTAAGWVVPSRGMTADGSQVYFDTPQALVPQDTNGVRDVYEWVNGKVYLVSSGTDAQPSFFLDNSASGRDVFFATVAGLVRADTDGGYDVYDAREGGGFSQQPLPSECLNSCQVAANPPTLPQPGSAALSGLGNSSATAPDPPTSRSRKLSESVPARLARALRACRAKRDHRARGACERAARRRYRVPGAKVGGKRR
jgi:hypothetical protein